MWREKLIQKKQVFTYAGFVDAKEADVEDVLGKAFDLKLVNAEYAADLGKPIVAKGLKSKHPRITVQLEEHFTEKPLHGGVAFNHYRPARRLAETVGKLKFPAAVMDRFEAICKAVNATLVRSGEN